MPLAQSHRAITIRPGGGVPTCHLSVICLSTDDSSMSLQCICVGVCVCLCALHIVHIVVYFLSFFLPPAPLLQVSSPLFDMAVTFFDSM